MATQLPPAWKENFDPISARKYYVNHQTRQTSWTLPSESPLPAGWEQFFDSKGRVFFFNHDEGTTTWTDPRDQNTAPAPAPANTRPVSSPAATAPVKPAPKQYDTGTLVSFRRGAFWKKGLIVSSDYSGQVVFWEDGEQGKWTKLYSNYSVWLVAKPLPTASKTGANVLSHTFHCQLASVSSV